MTRTECEAKLLKLAEEMRDVYMEYNPAGDFMSATMDSNGYISVTDCYFNGDGLIIRDANGRCFRTIDAVKYADGSVRYSLQDAASA